MIETKMLEGKYVGAYFPTLDSYITNNTASHCNN